MKQLAILVLGAFCLGSFASHAKDSVIQQTLSSVSAPELPAKAADMVKKAKARDWGSTTVNVVKTAVGLKPASAPAIVAAIAHEVPDMASIAASTAVMEQPKQAAAITKAAAAAAPSKVAKIVTAVCRVAPADYRAVAVAAAEAVPSANKEIVSAIGTAIPELRTSLTGLAPQNAASMAQALDKVAASQSAVAANTGAPAASSTVRGPTIGAPYIPAPATPPNTVTPTTTEQVPTGGRDYASP